MLHIGSCEMLTLTAFVLCETTLQHDVHVGKTEQPSLKCCEV